MPGVEVIKIMDIVRDDRLHFRDPASHKVRARSLAEAMRERDGWGDLPPVQCVRLTAAVSWFETHEKRRMRRTYTAGQIILVGGFARCSAAELSSQGGGRLIIEAPAAIRPGTWLDALQAAWLESTDGRAAQ